MQAGACFVPADGSCSNSGGGRSIQSRRMLRIGWSDVEAIGDLAGIPRVLAARWTP